MEEDGRSRSKDSQCRDSASKWLNIDGKNIPSGWICASDGPLDAKTYDSQSKRKQGK